MKKNIGIGSTSLLLVVFAIIWSTNINNYCLGDEILKLLNLASWSDKTTGIHYTVFYSYIFLIPALLISIKYKNDLFTSFSKYLSIFLIITFSITTIFMIN